MACTMRCRHCGSACATGLPDELTTAEALALSDDLAALGTRLVTLSGGEPLLRDDWHLLARRLTDRGVTVNIISNGWLIDEGAIDRAIEGRLDNIGVSLDGMEATHDFIRCAGSFRRVVASLDRVRSRGIPTAVVTTLMKPNLPDLDALYRLLVDLGVERWQLQIGAPMGSMAEHRDEVIDPEEVATILEFARSKHGEGRLGVVLSDCLGYFTRISTELRAAQFGPGATWTGCPAGRYGLGVRHNGDICGCTSMRDDRFIEGNVRETPLRELWHRPGAFAWNRDRSRESLSGFCRYCQFADLCLAGCSSLRLAMGDEEGEYTHCAHRVAIERLFPKVDAVRSLDRLSARAHRAADLGLFEIADRCLRRALEMAPADPGLLELAGYVSFRIGDWERCRRLNEGILARDPENRYALKGLGLALARLGSIDRGIAALRRAVELSDRDFMDPYHDLAVVLCEQDLLAEAMTVLEAGRELSDDFRRSSDGLYQAVAEELAETVGGIADEVVG
jgi:radical SAM protein with 4Fe4S-binding SPASM domain